MIRHADRWAALVLLAIALMLLAPVVTQPGGLIYPPSGDFTDLTITHWPNAEFALASLRATGRLPLWRPTIMSGAPFAANPLSGLFYFPHAILLFLPLAIGFNALFIAHVWLTGCGAYALLRAWQLDRPAAFMGGLTWMATPKLFAHLGAGHVGMVEAVAWMPLVIWATHRLAENRRVMDGTWLGAVWAIQFLADPRTSFYSVGLSLTYILVAVVFGERISKRSASFWVAWRPGVLGTLCAVLAFVALSAMLWVPFAEFVAQSNRGALTLAEAGEWSLPARQLASLFLADWGGFHEWTLYVGVLPLILGLVAVSCTLRIPHRASYDGQVARGTQQGWLIAWLTICSVAAALFSLGTNGPLFPILYRCLPGLTFLRVPPRAWFIVAFAVAMLCAFGVQAMAHKVCRPRGWVTLLGVGLGAFALLLGLGGFWSLQGNTQANAARAAMLHLALVAPVSVLVALLRAHGRIGPRAFATASAVVIAATLWPVDLSLYRAIPEAQAFSERAEVVAWLTSQPGTFRTYSPSYSLPQHIAQRAGLELADGVDPMQVASYAKVMQVATGVRAQGYSVTIPAFEPHSDVRQALRDATPDARLLGRLNVRYVVAEFPVHADGLVERARFGTTFVYENEQAYPRAFVEEEAAGRITVNVPDRVVVEADGPGILTLSQVYYPGWRASVDGRPASIQTRDSLTGVQLSAGRHVVEFVFAPWTVTAGLLVSGIGWGGLLAFGLIRLSSFVLSRRGLPWNRVGK